MRKHTNFATILSVSLENLKLPSAELPHDTKKLHRIFMAMIKLAAIRLWCQFYESAA